MKVLREIRPNSYLLIQKNMKTAKEFLIEKHPFMADIWNKTNVNDDWVCEMMSDYLNYNLDELANQSQEMIYDRKDTKLLESGNGLVLRDFQVCYAVPKQTIFVYKK